MRAHAKHLVLKFIELWKCNYNILASSKSQNTYVLSWVCWKVWTDKKLNCDSSGDCQLIKHGSIFWWVSFDELLVESSVQFVSFPNRPNSKSMRSRENYHLDFIHGKNNHTESLSILKEPEII